MKTLINGLMAFSFTVAVVGCGGGNTASTSADPQVSTEVETPEVTQVVVPDATTPVDTTSVPQVETPAVVDTTDTPQVEVEAPVDNTTDNSQVETPTETPEVTQVDAPVVIPETIRTYELIINNGRGTTNNQHTERSDTATVNPNGS